MLGRLAELRDQSGVSVSVPQEASDEKPSDGEASAESHENAPDGNSPCVNPSDEKPSHEKPSDGKLSYEFPSDEKPCYEKPSYEKPSDEKPCYEKPSDEKPSGEKHDMEQLDFVAEVHALYKDVLEDEAAMVQACEEVRRRVDNMEEIVELERRALLPAKLAQLANRFESQEVVCQHMIRRAKEMLTNLRDEQQDYDEEDDIAHIAVRPVRAAIAAVRAKEFKGVVSAFFAARSHNRTDMMNRASRQLRYAYPDALEEELNDIMDFPELAFIAISRRLERGSEVTLEGILGEMEGKKADSRKLEQGAKELKLMFLQFAELIDNQGENLSAVEANIKTVIEETSEAIGLLTDADAEKRVYERRKMKFVLAVALLIFYFFIWPFFKGEESSGWGIASFVTNVFHAGAATAVTAVRATAGPVVTATKQVAVADEAKDASSKKSSLTQVVGISPWQSRHRQVQGQSAHQLSQDDHIFLGKREAVPAGIAPHKPLIDNSVMRSVAVMARGGATTSRHSGLRKARMATQQNNSTAS